MSAITVSKLVRYLKNKLDGDTNLQSITVIGELSNFHRHNSGHLYFTLKDSGSAINCVMFLSCARLIKFTPKNGDKVEIQASCSLFEVTGQLQLYVNSMKLQGVGDLFARYEELKNKLNEEGYFDTNHKKAIPTKYPLKVAVLVGDKSAAMSDIKICFKRRWPICKVDYYPVLVQGIDAPKDIIKTLNKVDDLDYEMIILARGGGSFEDLFCFNDETLVKTIYNLKTFIISGIGHEQDFTLADFVSDLRAPTPTATVELITPNINDLISDVLDLEDSIKSIMHNKLKNLSDKLDNLSNNKYFVNPNLIIDKTKMKLDYLDSKLINYSNKLINIENDINNNLSKMKFLLNIKLDKNKNKLDGYSNLLKAYSVDNTLKRGYSLVYKEDKLIKNKKELIKDDLINIRLFGGNIKAEVKGE